MNQNALEIRESHLLQMRGLKPVVEKSLKPEDVSHLLQMRGLKQVATHEGINYLCRIFYRCVD